MSTWVAAGNALRALAGKVPELVGGAADVESSTETHLTGYPDVGRNEWDGRNIHFGVREHTMGAIVVGMAAHGGLRPFGATLRRRSSPRPNRS